ncbi:cupredoxin domain-containing protein [Bartonella sp. TP]|uniref:cupredoxin domain-containing protein n=1 Tax=Bartonella sp. TP TaxID=3057550 RepID=UPI0025B1F4D4|nr:cupredoxin domain-containing protein [Bartonella sp. TP]MDN5249312.1 cupredoxin domain-containing protein [Alphaproteobacteria bacterium]WJW79737.1 cupredoxin domain-containing protein [Bartonella sp. TP]
MANKWIYILLTTSLYLLAPNYAMANKPAVYNLEIKDGVFTPPFISVPAHQRIKIIIKNTGTSPAEFENLSLIVEKTLGSGVQSFAIIPPLRPGTYKFIDEFHSNMNGFKINAK